MGQAPKSILQLSRVFHNILTDSAFKATPLVYNEGQHYTRLCKSASAVQAFQAQTGSFSLNSWKLTCQQVQTQMWTPEGASP